MMAMRKMKAKMIAPADGRKEISDIVRPLFCYINNIVELNTCEF